MTATITTAELAEALGTDPRTLRKFLRADARSRDAADTLPGKGSRYALDGSKRSITALGKKFAKWTTAQEAAKAAKADESPDEG